MYSVNASAFLTACRARLDAGQFLPRDAVTLDGLAANDRLPDVQRDEAFELQALFRCETSADVKAEKFAVSAASDTGAVMVQ